MSIKEPVPWHTIPEKEWQEGFAAVARRYGVNRKAAHSAYKRLQAREGAASVTGRPVKALPVDLDRTMGPSAVAALYGVSVPTAARWLRTPAVVAQKAPKVRSKQPKR